MFSVNSTIMGRKHTIYASNSSEDLEKGTVLYHGESLPQNISINAIFRYLTFVPDNKSAVIELDICEIGIVGEYLIRNTVYKSEMLMYIQI